MVKTTQAVMLGVVVLFIAFAFPAFIGGASDGQVESTLVISGGVGDSEQAEEAFVVTLTDKTSNTVDLSFTSLVTGDNTTVTLTEQETANVQLDNKTITTTAIDIQSGSGGEVTLRTIYPADFAWSDSAISLSNELPIVLAVIPLLIITALIGAVVRS